VPEKVDLNWLISKADAAQGRRDHAEAVRHLARAAAISPVDRALQLRLASTAVTARDYMPAAKAAVAANELLSGASAPLVELRLAYRCRGSRARAEWIDDSGDVSRMPVDACIETLEQQQCEPCDCGGAGEPPEQDSCETDDACGDGRACVGSVCVNRCSNGVTCQAGEECEAGRCVAPEVPKSDLELYQDAESARLDKLNQIDRTFPEGSWLRIKVTGPSRASPTMKRVIVFQYHLEKTGAADGDEPTCESAEAKVTAIDTVPIPAPGQDVTLWVHVPAYEDATYGVDFGTTVEQVAGQIESMHSSCGAQDPQHSIRVQSGASQCGSSCSCT
jgi:hypothetical protein